MQDLCKSHSWLCSGLTHLHHLFLSLWQPFKQELTASTDLLCKTSTWGLTWNGLQATVQATLAALPMDQVNSLIPKGTPKYAQYSRWAEDALVTAIFCILICGSLGTVLIRWFSGFLLDKARLPPSRCPLVLRA